MRMLRSASGRVCLLLFAACTMPAYANVVVTTYLNLTQLTITPQAGTLDILLPWTASAFADAHDSIGGTSQQSNSVDDSSISASASTTLANAAGSAATSPPAGTSSSGVSIAGLNASAASTGRGRIAGSFQIIGTPDPVLVHISAALSGLQDLFTDANGVSASSEIIFSFKLDSKPGPDPFYDSIKSIGPNQSLSAPYSSTLGADVTLTPGTQYNFIAEVDSESSGVDSIPEPWTVMLMLTGLCLILARRRLSER